MTSTKSRRSKEGDSDDSAKQKQRGFVGNVFYLNILGKLLVIIDR